MEFICSLCGICIVWLKPITEDQMVLFLRRDSKGLGDVSAHPRVRKIKGTTSCAPANLEAGDFEEIAQVDALLLMSDLQ
jgi:hypothetical protein